MEGVKSLFAVAVILAALSWSSAQSIEVDMCFSCPGQRRQGSGVAMEVSGHGMDPGVLMFSFLPQAMQLRDLLHRELQIVEGVFGNNEDLLRVFRESMDLPSPAQPHCQTDNPAAAVVSQLTSVAVYVKAIASRREANLCGDPVHRYVNSTLQMTQCGWELVYRSLNFHRRECACVQSLPASVLPESCSELDAWSYKALLWAHGRVSEIVSAVEACALDFPQSLPPHRQRRWARRCLRSLRE